VLQQAAAGGQRDESLAHTLYRRANSYQDNSNTIGLVCVSEAASQEGGRASPPPAQPQQQPPRLAGLIQVVVELERASAQVEPGRLAI
jgi:hypothetical protein